MSVMHSKYHYLGFYFQNWMPRW